MDFRKNQLWKVPLYCVIAGQVCYRLYIFAISRFAVVITPDKTVEVNYVRALLLSGILLAAVLFLGWRFLCGMSKKELFLSATVMVVFEILVGLLQAIVGTSGLLGNVLLSLSMGNREWCGFVPNLLMRFAGSAWPEYICFLMPYVFVLFGKKKSEEAAE